MLSVNKPAAASPWGRQNSYLKLTCICDSFFVVCFFVTKLRQNNWKQWQHYFMQTTGWVKQRCLGNWMYQVEAPSGGSQLLATSLCLRKGTDAGVRGWGRRRPWRSALLPLRLYLQSRPCVSICRAIPGRLLFRSVLRCGNGEIYLGSNFQPIISLVFKPFWQASPTPPLMNVSLVTSSPSCTYSSFGCMLC